MITNLFVGIFITLIYLIPALIVTAIIIGLISLIKTRVISNTFKIIIIIIILLCVFIILINIKHEKPNDLYIKMKSISDNKSLIGLSKEEVIELLGEPEKVNKYSDIDKEVYLYNAGHIFKEITLGKHTMWAKTYWYVLSIKFNKTDKVESTLMKESVELVI